MPPPLLDFCLRFSLTMPIFSPPITFFFRLSSILAFSIFAAFAFYAIRVRLRSAYLRYLLVLSCCRFAAMPPCR